MEKEKSQLIPSEVIEKIFTMLTEKSDDKETNSLTVTGGDPSGTKFELRDLRTGSVQKTVFLPNVSWSKESRSNPNQ